MLQIEAHFCTKSEQHRKSPLQCYQATLMVAAATGVHVAEIAPGQGKTVDILLAAYWLKHRRQQTSLVATLNDGLRVQMQLLASLYCPELQLVIVEIVHLNADMGFQVAFIDEADAILESHLFHLKLG